MVFRYHRALIFAGVLALLAWSITNMYLKLCSWWADLDMKSRPFVWTSISAKFILFFLKLSRVLIQAGLVLSKYCADLSSQTWKRGGFYKADGSLWSVPTVLFGWDMPLKVMSLPSQVLRGEKYVWENGNMLWNALFPSPPHPTTSHFLLLGKSTWQVFSSHCQLC